MASRRTRAVHSKKMVYLSVAARAGPLVRDGLRGSDKRKKENSRLNAYPAVRPLPGSACTGGHGDAQVFDLDRANGP